MRNPHLIGDLEWHDELAEALEKFNAYLKVEEIHFTGGEPSANPSLPNLVRNLRENRFKVKMTSIGCRLEKIAELAESGLQGINFSLHALDHHALHGTQIDRSLPWVNTQLDQEIKAIIFARKLGLEVKLNTVVTNANDFARAKSVLAWAKEQNLSLRFLNNISNSEDSIMTIKQLCQELGAVEYERKYIFGSSSYTVFYKLPDGYQFGAKLIGETYLKSICSSCSLRAKGKCHEKFYGIRLEKRLVDEKWGLFVRLCLHRTDKETYYPINTFFESLHIKELQEMIAPKDWLTIISNAN